MFSINDQYEAAVALYWLENNILNTPNSKHDCVFQLKTINVTNLEYNCDNDVRVHSACFLIK